MSKDFSNLDGEVIDYQVLSGMSDLKGNPFDEDNFYSQASGKKRKKRSGGFFNKLADNQREKNKAKFEAQKINAQAQLKATDSLGKESQSDIELAKALASSPSNDTTTKPPMSMGMKVGIGVLVLGAIVGGYFLYKKMKKGGK